MCREIGPRIGQFGNALRTRRPPTPVPRPAPRLDNLAYQPFTGSASLSPCARPPRNGVDVVFSRKSFQGNRGDVGRAAGRYNQASMASAAGGRITAGAGASLVGSGQRDRVPEATCYLGNLEPRVTEEFVWELFMQCGPVVSVYLPKDRVTNEHQGYGFVEFKSDQDADYVSALLSGSRHTSDPPPRVPPSRPKSRGKVEPQFRALRVC